MKKVWIVDDDQEMVGAIRLMVKMLDCDDAISSRRVRLPRPYSAANVLT